MILYATRVVTDCSGIGKSVAILALGSSVRIAVRPAATVTRSIAITTSTRTRLAESDRLLVMATLSATKRQ
jgi:hypothetical protein